MTTLFAQLKLQLRYNGNNTFELPVSDFDTIMWIYTHADHNLIENVNFEIKK